MDQTCRKRAKCVRAKIRHSGWRPWAPILLLFATPTLLSAQETLSLEQAIRLALEQNPALRASDAAANGAAERVAQARAGYLPTVNYSESVQYGTNPVYVFGSLLEQHRFRATNFDLNSLNRPDALTNFSSQVSAEQMVFDGNKTRDRTRSAQLGLAMTQEQKRQSQADILAAVAEAYYAAVLAREGQRVAEESLATADADLERALSLRDAGMTTDADVLSLRLSRSEGQERLIRAENDLAIAQARLNDFMGAPLTTTYTLASFLRPAPPVGMQMLQLENEALEKGLEALQAKMALRDQGEFCRVSRPFRSQLAAI